MSDPDPSGASEVSVGIDSYVNLARRYRLVTFEWLVSVLMANSRQSWFDARQALDAELPAGSEGLLDDAATFMPVLRAAAARLGVTGVMLRLHERSVQ